MFAVFHGGATVTALALMFAEEVDSDEQLQQAAMAAMALSQAVVDVGLGEMMDYGYLRLDPALPPYLAGVTLTMWALSALIVVAVRTA